MKAQVNLYLTAGTTKSEQQNKNTSIYYTEDQAVFIMREHI